MHACTVHGQTQLINQLHMSWLRLRPVVWRNTVVVCAGQEPRQQGNSRGQVQRHIRGIRGQQEQQLQKQVAACVAICRGAGAPSCLCMHVWQRCCSWASLSLTCHSQRRQLSLWLPAAEFGPYQTPDTAVYTSSHVCLLLRLSLVLLVLPFDHTTGTVGSREAAGV